jgi:hypothetical protein
MIEEMKKGKSVRTLLRYISFGIFGSAALLYAEKPLSPVFLIYGILIGIAFGLVYNFVLKLILGVANKDLKKQHGSKIVSLGISKGLLFIVPFAIMALLAAYVMGWTITTGFVSAGLMTAGATITMELEKIKGNGTVKNSLLPIGISFVFATIWAVGIGYMAILSLYVDGGVNVLLSLANDLVK